MRCTFSVARAWRLAAGPASTRTLGLTTEAVLCSSRISACRRELNSHEDGGELGRDWAPCYSPHCRRTVRRDRKAQGQKARGRNNAAAGCESDDWEPPCYIETPRCVGGHRLQSVRWVASGTGASANSQGSEWLECAACQPRKRRAARRRGGHRKLRGPRSSRLRHAKRGLTLRSRRGPTALRLARAAPVVHDAPRGQGTIPSVPPHLKR